MLLAAKLAGFGIGRGTSFQPAALIPLAQILSTVNLRDPLNLRGITRAICLCPPKRISAGHNLITQIKKKKIISTTVTTRTFES